MSTERAADAEADRGPGAAPAENSYALRILAAIEAQQAELGIAKRTAAQSRKSPARGQGRAEESDRALEAEYQDLKKTLRRQKQAMQRQLDLRKWRARYDALMLETSLEYRLGKLVREYLPDGGEADIGAVLAALADPNHPHREAMRAAFESILRDEAVRQALLPLLDEPPAL